MKTFVTTSSATQPLGASTGQKVLRIASGAFAGRIALLYQDTVGSISLRWADAPYTSWPGSTTLANDAADSPFDAWMDSAGDIFLVYTQGISFDLLFRRITFSAGVWTAGSSVLIYNTDDCYFHSITFEAAQRLWVTYTRIAAGSYFINAQKSDDFGLTWAAGAGETLSAAGTSAFSQIIVSGSLVQAFYTLSGTKLALKDKHVIASEFNVEQTLASGAGFDKHFHAAAAPDGRVGLLYDHGTLSYREFDGVLWLAAQEIDSSGGASPRVTFSGSSAALTYLQNFGANQNRLMSSVSQGGSFTTPADLTLARAALGNLSLFDASAGTYENLTAQASSGSAADVFHSISGALISGLGDAIYFGQTERFNYLQLALSTVGVGGNVAWQYFDGAGWIAFTPTVGAYHFTLGARDHLLWADIDSTPTNWQTTTINGVPGFYVRAIVNGVFSAAPIGSQLTGIPNTTELITEV